MLRTKILDTFLTQHFGNFSRNILMRHILLYNKSVFFCYVKAFMVFSLIYTYITLFVSISYSQIMNFFILLLLLFCFALPLVLLFSQEIFAKDTCNYNVIPDSSN